MSEWKSVCPTTPGDKDLIRTLHSRPSTSPSVMFSRLWPLSPSDKSSPAHPVVFSLHSLWFRQKIKERSKHTNWNFTGPVNNCTHLGLFICGRTLFTLSRHVLCITYEGGKIHFGNIMPHLSVCGVRMRVFIWPIRSSRPAVCTYSVVACDFRHFFFSLHASTFSHLRRVWARQTTGCWAGVN